MDSDSWLTSAKDFFFFINFWLVTSQRNVKLKADVKTLVYPNQLTGKWEKKNILQRQTLNN